MVKAGNEPISLKSPSTALTTKAALLLLALSSPSCTSEDPVVEEMKPYAFFLENQSSLWHHIGPLQTKRTTSSRKIMVSEW